ncbi:hypothetical protein MXZ29_02690 [Streptococcus uberis]|nr:hypothetical protein [Streptococcus uberis]
MIVLIYHFPRHVLIMIVKWLNGWAFFLSEHNHSLEKDRHKKSIISLLDLEEKHLYLGQAYSQQSPVIISVFDHNQLQKYEGLISKITSNHFQLKTKKSYKTFSIDSLITIEQEDKEAHG